MPNETEQERYTRLENESRDAAAVATTASQKAKHEFLMRHYTASRSALKS